MIVTPPVSLSPARKFHLNVLSSLKRFTHAPLKDQLIQVLALPLEAFFSISNCCELIQIIYDSVAQTKTLDNKSAQTDSTAEYVMTVFNTISHPDQTVKNTSQQSNVGSVQPSEHSSAKAGSNNEHSSTNAGSNNESNSGSNSGSG